jgi:hypothetical protein
VLPYPVKYLNEYILMLESLSWLYLLLILLKNGIGGGLIRDWFSARVKINVYF